MTPKEKRDAAVDAFAAAMKARLDWGADVKGYTGWDGEYPSELLRDEIDADVMSLCDAADEKALDIAARCMFLWYRQAKPALSCEQSKLASGAAPRAVVFAAPRAVVFLDTISVRPYGGTYIARCRGKTASCTSSEEAAARAVARKVMGDEPFTIMRQAGAFRIAQVSP